MLSLATLWDPQTLVDQRWAEGWTVAVRENTLLTCVQACGCCFMKTGKMWTHFETLPFSYSCLHMSYNTYLKACQTTEQRPLAHCLRQDETHYTTVGVSVHVNSAIALQDSLLHVPLFVCCPPSHLQWCWQPSVGSLSTLNQFEGLWKLDLAKLKALLYCSSGWFAVAHNFHLLAAQPCHRSAQLHNWIGDLLLNISTDVCWKVDETVGC